MNRVSASFIARTVSHCQDYLKVRWADGVTSSYPSTFLRANVRDATFFDENSLLHLPEHNQFLHKCTPITQADHLNSNEIKVTWKDHDSIFNVPWLRAQDEDNLPRLVRKITRVPWEKGFKPIDYDYSEAEPRLSSWMNDVEKYGCVMFHNVPPNLEGFRSIVHLIGPPSQRRHPTNEFYLQANLKKMKVDVASYTANVLNAHSDHSYYVMPTSYISLLATEYSHAPQRDTESVLINSYQVAEQLREEDPEGFELLSTMKVRQARRRLGVEEECHPSEVQKYEWDILLDRPIINLDEHRQVTEIRLHLYKHLGLPFVTSNKDEKLLKRFYQAHEKFLQLCTNPRNRIKFVLRQGMLIIFDNHKLLHGRGPIHPSTNRHLIGGYTSGESWTSRRRLCLGKRAELAEKWLLGCSENSLMALAERFEENDRDTEKKYRQSSN